MEETTQTSLEARRDRVGGIVRDKLDLLMDETRKEPVPEHLKKLAEELQSAIYAKTASPDDPS